MKIKGYQMDQEKFPVTIRPIMVNEKNAKVMIQNAKLAFVSLAEPNTRFGKKDTEGKVITGLFTVTPLIPKTNKKFIEDFNKIIDSVIRMNSSNFGKKPLTSTEKKEIFKIATSINKDGSLLKDGDKKQNADGKLYDGLPGNYSLMVKTEAQLVEGKWTLKVPINVRRLDKSIMRKDEIQNEMYSGVYADIMATLSPYKSGTTKGVTAYLGDVMKLMDGERLGAADPFEDRSDDFPDSPETTEENEF